MTKAVCVVLIFPVLPVKVPTVALAGIVTEAGSIRTLGMPPERVTFAPPAGATLLNVTVQLVLALGARAVAAHCNEDTSTGAIRERVTAFDEALREAVMVAV